MLIMTATQQCALALEITDSHGNPAQVDGVPAWSSADDGKVSVEPSADGMSATIFAEGPMTTAPVQISVTADADMGEGIKPLVGLLDVTIIGGEATVIAITPGTPTEQP